ncbi:hypothetical protein INR49_023573 [Caranx melampygus]|nr:hypothetical protein INR49_023573 [Caranx melampygus]
MQSCNPPALLQHSFMSLTDKTISSDPQALQLFEMDDIQTVESKPLLVDRELPGLREAVQQLVIKEHDVETPHGRIHCTMKGVPKGTDPSSSPSMTSD